MLGTTIELEAARRICLENPEGKTDLGVPYEDIYELIKAMSVHANKVDFDLFAFPYHTVQWLMTGYRLYKELGFPDEACSVALVEDARFVAYSYVEGPFRWFPTTLN